MCENRIAAEAALRGWLTRTAGELDESSLYGTKTVAGACRNILRALDSPTLRESVSSMIEFEGMDHDDSAGVVELASAGPGDAGPTGIAGVAGDVSVGGEPPRPGAAAENPGMDEGARDAVTSGPFNRLATPAPVDATELFRLGAAHPRGHTSWSAMQRLWECPASLLFNDLGLVPEAPAWWFIGGHAVHAATAAVESPSPDQAAALFVAYFEAETRTVLEGQPGLSVFDIRSAKRGVEGRDWWLVEGPEMIQRFWAAYNRLLDQGWLPAATEEKIVQGIPNVHGIDLVCIPDRVMIRQLNDSPPEVLVLDLKTGASSQPSTWQLAIGAIAWELREGYDPTRVNLGAFLDLRKDDPPVLSDLSGIMGLALAQLQRASAVLTSGQYLPQPGPQCWKCRFSNICPGV